MKLALISLFISPKDPPLGLCSIATYLEKYSNFRNTVIIDINFDNILERVAKEKPDIIGISAMTIYYSKAVKVAREIKKRFDIPIIIGGNHISTLPESLEKCFDIGVIGEAEETMKELVDLYRKKKEFLISDLKKVKGIVFYDNNKLIKTEPRPPIIPLDKIPVLNRSYLNQKYFRKTRSFATGDFEVDYKIPTSRGCPYRCKFCSPSAMWGNKVRFHSLDRIAEEIKIGINKYNATYIKFMDDLFAVSKERLRGLYAKLKEEELLGKVKLGGAVRANLVDDELCILLKKIGIVSTATGYESGNEGILRYLKGGSVTVKDNYRAILLFEKYKIPNFGSFIFGSPNETLEQMKYTLKLIKFAYKHKMEFIYIYLLKPFPGTEIWEIAKKRNIVSNDMDWETLTLFVDNLSDVHKPIMMSSNININEFKKIYYKALKYSRLAAMKRLLRTFIKFPIRTIKDVGNPVTFIKNNLSKKTNTFKLLKAKKENLI